MYSHRVTTLRKGTSYNSLAVSHMQARSEKLARLLMLGNGVRAVELFGSIARGKCTLESDFDVILCVEDVVAARWHTQVNAMLRYGGLYTSDYIAIVRREFALKAIGIDLSQIYLATGIDPGKQDYFLFPLNWRHQLNELQALGRHVDPCFMQNIAQDALTFVPHVGFPFPD